MLEQRSETARLTAEQLKAIEEVAVIAAAQAGSALSRLSRLPVLISSPTVKSMSLGEIPALFGGLSIPAVGVLVPFRGDVEGNTLLIFPEEGAGELERSLLGDPGQTERDLRDSAFAEMGNILTGSLLTVLSSLSEKVLISDVPHLVQDMAGAILDAMLAEVGAGSDQATIILFNLSVKDGGSLVRSVFIPGAEGVELLLQAASRLGA